MQGSRSEGFSWDTYISFSGSTTNRPSTSDTRTKQLMPARTPRSLEFNDYHDSRLELAAVEAGGIKTERSALSVVLHVPKSEPYSGDDDDDDAAAAAAPVSRSTTATTTTSSSTGGSAGAGNYNNHSEGWDNLQRMASENAVVMFSISSCCVCHVVKRLFSSLGVAPAVYELDHEDAGAELTSALQSLAGSSQPLPAIFIGKKYIGGLQELIAAHIGAALVPQLKQAGALWL